LNKLVAIIILLNSLFLFTFQSKAQETEKLDSMLLILADSADYEAAVILLNAGADPNADTWDGVTALMYASQSGNYKLVKELIIWGADINAKPYNGNTALHSAVIANHDSIAELLILNGADVNAANEHGAFPLHFSCAYGYPFLSSLLIYYGAYIDSTDNYGNTPLMLTVYSGAVTIAQILLEEWADVDKTDKEGFTPLMVAAHYNDTLMLRLLIDYGADPLKINSFGATALSIAIANRAEEAAFFLLSKGAYVEEINSKKSYAQLAKESGLRDLSIKLIGLGSPSYSKPIVKSTTLQTAALFNGNDFYITLGTNLNMLDFGFNFGFDFGFRPYFKAVLVEEEDISYQFYEKRQFLALSVQKEIPVKFIKPDIKYSIVFGAGALYSWGRYNYTNARTLPERYLRLFPALGVCYYNRGFYLALQGKMLNMKHFKDQSVMLCLSAGYAINSSKLVIRKKTVPWY
jgi:ankyrin repeat protein